MPIPDLESTAIPSTCKVHFTKSKVNATWTASSNLSLLQFAEAQGLKPDYGCRSGMCGTCETKLVKGKTEGGVGDSDGRTSRGDENGKGKGERETWVLICCSVPRSEEIWLEK